MRLRAKQKKQAVWQDIVPSKHTSKLQQPTQKKLKHRHEIVLVLPTLPKLRIPKKLHGLFLKTRHRRILTGILLCLILIAVIVFIPRQNPSQTEDTSDSTDSTQTSPQAGLVPGTPSYKTLLPAGKTVKDLGGGWVRDEAHPLFVYIDTIDKIQINVSEQPLPDDFKDDPTKQVEALATSLGANEKITVGSIAVHIGVYGKDLQRVILTKNNLLILITANNTITTNQWATYINSLN